MVSLSVFDALYVPLPGHQPGGGRQRHGHNALDQHKGRHGMFDIQSDRVVVEYAEGVVQQDDFHLCVGVRVWPRGGEGPGLVLGGHQGAGEITRREEGKGQGRLQVSAIASSRSKRS